MVTISLLAIQSNTELKSFAFFICEYCIVVVKLIIAQYIIKLVILLRNIFVQNVYVFLSNTTVHTTVTVYLFKN